MTNAVGTSDDEILTTEVEPEPRAERIDPVTARRAFLALAAVAAIALLAAIAIVVLAPNSAITWLVVALGVLVVVVVAEIVLLLLARPRRS